MKKIKTQTFRLLNGFITSVVIITSVILVGSGIAISKTNTDYMSTGVRAAKIAASRESRQISIVMNDSILLAPKQNLPLAEKVLPFLPPPINTGYILFKELSEKKRS